MLSFLLNFLNFWGLNHQINSNVQHMLTHEFTKLHRLNCYQGSTIVMWFLCLDIARSPKGSNLRDSLYLSTCPMVICESVWMQHKRKIRWTGRHVCRLQLELQGAWNTYMKQLLLGFCIETSSPPTFF